MLLLRLMSVLSVSLLHKAVVPELLIKLWLGHARNLTDRNALQLAGDTTYRGEWLTRAGLGFGLHEVTNVVSITGSKVA